MIILDFVRRNARWLGAGMLLSGGSGFGQTYFISIFAGEIRGEFGLSHGEWGGIYTIGTTLSAILMLVAGGLVDRATVRVTASWVLVAFALVCVGMAINTSAWILILIVFGLRFCGQGMLSHIPMVAAGRWFAANRGRAVSIIALGFSLGEALLPFLFVAIAASVGWRNSWVVAALLALTLIPIIHRLLREERKPEGSAETVTGVGMYKRQWTRRQAMTHWVFWMTLPAFMIMPIFSTALFFQQVHLTETKGWALESFVLMFPLMSGSTILTMLFAGNAIDRVGAGPFLMVMLLPMSAAFLVFGSATSISLAALGFVLMGMSHGMNAALGGTFWPEYYGTQHLGSIRAVATSVMVFSSALGPGITGYLIDAGYPFEDQMPFVSGLAVLATALAAVAMMRARPAIAAA